MAIDISCLKMTLANNFSLYISFKTANSYF